VFKEGEIEIVANDLGERTTPSWVAFTDSERLIGQAAKNQVHKNPKNTLYDIKRLIGRGYDDAEVQKDIKAFPFSVIDRSGKPQLSVKNQGKTQNFSPEEVSAMILTRMKGEWGCGWGEGGQEASSRRPQTLQKNTWASQSSAPSSPSPPTSRRLSALPPKTLVASQV
jgi:molecular chaperone DnaK (HSP70)